MLSGNKLEVKLVVEAGQDARERDELTTALRRQLLQLDAYSVDRPIPSEAPLGARAAGLAEIGSLIVTLGKSAPALGALVAAVQSWLAARQSGTVKMQLGEDTIEVTGSLSPEQKALIEAWITAHSRR